MPKVNRFLRGFASTCLLLNILGAVSRAEEIPTYKTANQEPKGATMQLVTFQPKMLLLPFEIKYPESWYVREEFTGVSSLYISREPILAMADRYTVGMAVHYHPYFFLPKKEDPNSSLGKLAESVITIQTWESVRESLLNTPPTPGQKILSKEEAMFSNQPALRIEQETDQARILTYYVKAGDHLMVWILEAPPNEFDKYSYLFKQIAEEFRFTR